MNNISINCTYDITYGQQLDLVADKSVALGPGFNVELGSYFNARIESAICN